MITVGSKVRVKEKSFEEFKSYFTTRGVRLGNHYTVYQVYVVKDPTHYYLLFEGFREWFNFIDFEDAYLFNLKEILS